MKLEIKTQCAECGKELTTVDRKYANYAVMEVFPCPTCHPPKDVKVTPKEGERIEVCDGSLWNGCFNARFAKGTRNKNGEILAVFSVGGASGPYAQWRYPGEKEWRD